MDPRFLINTVHTGQNTGSSVQTINPNNSYGTAKHQSKDFAKYTDLTQYGVMSRLSPEQKKFI